MDNNQNYEEIQLSNLWIKEHILDVIVRINKFEVIANVGSEDIEKLSQMSEYEITKEKLDGLKLMEAQIEVLKTNAWFKLSSNRKFHVILLFKQIQTIGDLSYFRQQDNQNEMIFNLENGFYVKLDLLQEIKGSLIEGIAEQGIFLPKINEDLEIKTSKDLEDE
ncbi:MAG TPA: hypothetical protein VMZ91_03345 [Candidatus Paceibacterota bacterium]|nr:hypothetical protein [Candidatus Paceibacterota bacterium]